MSSTATTEAGGTVQNLTSFKPRVTHVAYHVADIDRALAFYVGVLGLQEQLRLPLGGGLQEVILGFPGNPGAGVILMWHGEKKAPRQLGDGYSRFVLNVSDVEGALQLLAKHDTPVVTPLTAVGNFKFAMVKDPDGYIVELLQLVK
ncbi:MAG: VOC family protein [Polyangiales bacterium]